MAPIAGIDNVFIFPITLLYIMPSYPSTMPATMQHHTSQVESLVQLYATPRSSTYPTEQGIFHASRTRFAQIPTSLSRQSVHVESKKSMACVRSLIPGSSWPRRRFPTVPRPCPASAALALGQCPVSPLLPECARHSPSATAPCLLSTGPYTFVVAMEAGRKTGTRWTAKKPRRRPS